MSSIDGQKVWEAIFNCLDEDSRSVYFRLNFVLPGEEFALDDIARMDDLRSSIRLHRRSQQACYEVVIALLVSSFFFELSSPPVFITGSFHCRGNIKCRIPGKAIFKVLTHVKRTTWTYTTDAEVLGSYAPMVDRCPRCYLYKKPVEFRVRQLSEPFSIYMRDQRQRRRRISAFPQTVEWFINQQELETFGMSGDETSAQHCRPDGCCSKTLERTNRDHSRGALQGTKKRKRSKSCEA